MRSSARFLPLAIIVACAALQPCSGADSDTGGEFPLEILDVSMIVEPVEDFPGPRLELSPGRAVRAAMNDPFVGDLMSESRPKVMSEEDLEEFLKNSDPEWLEAAEGVRLTVSKRKLFLQGPPEAVARIRRTIAALEQEAGRTWCVRAVVVEAPAPGDGTEPLGTPPVVISSGEINAKLAAAKAAGWKILGDSSVCALSGQRVNVTDGRERSFIVDVDVEVAQSSAAADHIVEVLRDGLVLDVRPIPSPTGKTVRLDFFLALLKFEETGPLDTKSKAIGQIDLPRISGFRLASSVAVPEGAAILLGPVVPALPPASARDHSDVLPGKNGGGEKESRSPAVSPSVYVLLKVSKVR